MNDSQSDRILRAAKCRVRRNVALAPFTTFRLGGPAAIFAEPANSGELVGILKLARDESVDCFYLGHGSNIIVSDEGFDGVVIRGTGDLENLVRRDDLIVAGPAAKLLHLTSYAAHYGLSGIEKLSGIPGSVGGGLYMNAGAYGGELCETLTDVDVLTPDLNLLTLKASEIGFDYRSAPLLQDKIVLESRYRLTKGDKSAAYAEMSRVWKLRRDKQPLEYPSAGSIFKRPPGDFAGRLIEAVNGKGARIGGAMVSEKHAGFFINYESATASDVTALIREIRGRVKREFGILLDTEVKAIGFIDDPFQIEN